MSWVEDARDTHIAVTFQGDNYETCLVCSQPAPCLAIRLADELAYMERSRAAVVAKCADRVADAHRERDAAQAAVARVEALAEHSRTLKPHPDWRGKVVITLDDLDRALRGEQS